MKLEKFFQPVLVLVLALLLSACGSDNSTTDTTSYNPSTTSQSVTDFESFKTKVIDGNFIVQDQDSLELWFEDYIVDINTQDSTEWWIFTVNSSMNYNYQRLGIFFREESYNYVDHKNGQFDSAVETTHKQILDKLKAIIDKTKKYEKVYFLQAAYDVTTTDDKIYRIDLNSPLVANPIAFEDRSDPEEYKGYKQIQQYPYY